MYKPKENPALYVIITFILIFTIIFCIVYSSTTLSALSLNLNYYFVYQYTADNVISASSLSTAAESYGGAGYILSYNSIYYITVACYYDETSANSVSFNLKTKGMDCGVLAVSVTEKPISRANASNYELFSGNINTLEQVDKILYNLANGLDKGEINQSSARDSLNSVASVLEALYTANTDNCFSDPISNIIIICNNILNDEYIYSKNARKLQIAIIDCIINVDMT